MNENALVPVIYDLDEDGQAIYTRFYCTKTCRELAAVHDGSEDYEDQPPESCDATADTVCDYCGRPLFGVEP